MPYQPYLLLIDGKIVDYFQTSTEAKDHVLKHGLKGFMQIIHEPKEGNQSIVTEERVS